MIQSLSPFPRENLWIPHAAQQLWIFVVLQLGCHQVLGMHSWFLIHQQFVSPPELPNRRHLEWPSSGNLMIQVWDTLLLVFSCCLDQIVECQVNQHMGGQDPCLVHFLLGWFGIIIIYSNNNVLNIYAINRVSKVCEAPLQLQIHCTVAHTWIEHLETPSPSWGCLT